MAAEPFLFACSTDCPKFFAQALAAVAWRGPESQPCSVRISNPGLLFLTEDTNVLQASVSLKATLFRSFAFTGTDPYDFRVNLTALVSCLSLFAETATSIELAVDIGSDLRIRIADSGSTTECSIRTLHAEAELLNQPILSEAFMSKDCSEVASFIISSVVLREMFRFPNERKNKAVSIAMVIDPASRSFEVKAEGAYGVARSIIPFTQPDFLRVTLGVSERFAASYPVWSLTPVLNAMADSYETKFKFKGNGMLAAQLGIKGYQASGIETIVEFILQPLEEEVM
jgi:cell cycle checkpoint protein